ncbi:MAG: hypothetical protein C4518_20625 [Desulfobacteraceae bacterium]|nr:MAG: hypothetical protein C4518_20625 [Desulfobacteraceae bacterium]
MGKNNTVGKILFTSAFLLGGIAVGWMCAVFMHTNALALTVTLVIGAVYGIGAIELFQFRYATSTLTKALLRTKEKVTVLEDWLNALDESLHNSVRLRIQGERVGLPAPILTPYFVGLLVMLGLLGTFVGMVVTLKGAVIALEGTSELAAIRAGLAAPIKGLGLAFGTSVAGVATSAMLGLMSTLSKRDRMLATRSLDTRAATDFQDFSLAHSQQETFRALQIQTQALPEVSGRLHEMADKLEQVGETLIANQDRFQASIGRVFSELAVSMDKTHKESLAENVRLAGESIKPIVADVMNTIAQETRNVHHNLKQTAGDHLQALAGQFKQLTESMSQSFNTMTASAIAHQQTNDENRLVLWTSALESTQKESAFHFAESSKRISGLLKSSEDLIQARIRTEAAWLEEHQKRMDTLAQMLKSELFALRKDEELRGQAAVERLGNLESALADHLTTIGRAMEAPMTRLIQTAEEAPRAAADVISQLGREASKRAEQDTRQLEEQRRIITGIDALSRSLAQTSADQHAAIEALVHQSKGMLENVASQFTDRMGAEATRFSGVVENFAASAVEMASLGDAFSMAVTLFNESNEQLIQNLSRVEESLEKAAIRNDEQLGYYVAQAREIIDHCMLSQKEIFEDLQKLHQNNRISVAG